MSLIWAIPAVVAVIGVAVAMLGLRAVGVAAEDLELQLQRLGEVRLAVVSLRDEGAATRANLRNLRHR
jgi:hypothetical protein